MLATARARKNDWEPPDVRLISVLRSLHGNAKRVRNAPVLINARNKIEIEK